MNSNKDKYLKTNDMKKARKILGILLLVLIAAAVTITGCHNARHDKRMVRQGRANYGMNQAGRYRQQMTMQNMRRDNRQPMRPGMWRGQGNGMQPGAGRGMGQGMGPGMRRGGGPGMNNGINIGRGQQQGMMNNRGPGAGNVNSPMQMNPVPESQAGPAGIFIDRIPNVTEKQKQEYADLLQKQKDEMVKMRAEMAAKIKSTLESQRSKMLNLFTTEQKKYIGVK